MTHADAIDDVMHRAESRGIPVSLCNEDGGNVWLGNRRCQVLTAKSTRKGEKERSVFRLDVRGQPRVDNPEVWVLVDLVNAQTWIIPHEHVQNEVELVMPVNPHPKAKWELYREAWEYLK